VKYKLTVGLFLLTGLLMASPLTGIANAYTFNPNKIIDDGIFDNSNSMNASQIDVFINSFPNSCISPNSGFAAIDPVGYSPTSGFSYGGYVTAGKVIYDAAQAYGINPQVLISTLQKEQSLVVGGTNYCNNGDEHKYAAAVGYGCPDSGTTYSYTGLNLYQRNGVTVTSVGPTCVNTALKAGFSQQVIRAAWLLKFGEQRSEGNIGWAIIKGSWDNSDDPQSCYSGSMTQGTWQRCPSGATVFYDGYSTIDGTLVHMDNGATAALYWYTPHFSGNQHFFDIFTTWFGSTLFTVNIKYLTGDAAIDSSEDTATIPIKLAGAPLSTIQLNYTVSDPTVAKIIGSNAIVFNTSNWQTPQYITIQGLASSVSSKNVTLSVAYINSPDGTYDQSITQFLNRQPLFWSNLSEKAIYRLYNSTLGKHAYAVSADVKNTLLNNGYVIESTIGYQCPSSTNTPLVVDNSLGLVRNIDSPDVYDKQGSQPTIMFSNANGSSIVTILKNANSTDSVLSQNSTEVSHLTANGYSVVTSFLLCNQTDMPVYRLYGPVDGTHFYTDSAAESSAVQQSGYKLEDIAFYINGVGNTPVYRLYNPTNGTHFYTDSAAESSAVQQSGYKLEGIAFYRQ
jgi:hypothetical protein